MVNSAWISVTVANILGGVWAYFTLGWGGYWAWDPVETGLLLPWLTLTAYFHAKPLNENLSKAALALTGFSVAYASYVTRGGAYSPLHGFGGVSPAGTVMLLLGLPFIMYAFKLLGGLSLEVLKGFFRGVYKFSMAVAYFSILGIFAVSFLGLFVQNLYNILLGERLQIDVNYYNYLSSPFVLAFLLVIPGCTLPHLFRGLREYLKTLLAPLLVVSILGSALSLASLLVWSPHSPPTTNAIISLLIPPSLLGLGAIILGFYRSIKHRDGLNLSIRILHFSIPLMILGIILSGPYAYSNLIFKNYEVKLGDKVDFGGLKLEYVGVEFKGFVGKIAVPRIANIPLPREAPDEALVILKFKVYRGDGSSYTTSIPLRFNLGAYLRGVGGIVSEPMVLAEGLNEHYYIVALNSGVESIYYYGRQILDLAIKSEGQDVKHQYYGILYLLSRSVGLTFQEFIGKLSNWNAEDSSLKSSVTLSYKEVPYVGLVWASSIIMVLGSILAVIIRNIFAFKAKVEIV